MIAGIIGYRRYVSPLLGQRCRFEPSCSSYALDALSIYGAWTGSRLAAWRLLKCQPFHPGGFDPVPGSLRESDAFTETPEHDPPR